MPWKPEDAETHTKKANTPKRRKTWAKVANSRLAQCLKAIEGTPSDKQRANCEASAIRVANSIVANIKEQAIAGPDKCVCPDCDYETDKKRGTPCRSMECPECGVKLVARTEETEEMSMIDVRQIAASAIETALAVVNGTGEITAERAERLLYALEADLDAVDGVPVAEVATFDADGEQVTLTKLVATYHEAKKAAISEVGAGLESFTSQVRSAFQSVFKRKAGYSTDVLPEPYLWVKDIFFEHPGLGNAVIVDKEGALLMVNYTQDEEGHFTFAAPEDWERVKQTYIKVDTSETGTAELGEVELSERANFGEIGRGYAVNFIEAQADSPAYIDLVPVEAGWGNKKQNHYYDLPMLREYAHVWKGAKMWSSDHRQSDKNALNQVTEVVEAPIGFTEEGYPIVRAAILSAEFEEVARRRQEADILHTLASSILAEGTVRKAPFEKDGRKGKYVESIKAQNANIDWVTSAGAGGHAVGLAESNERGDQMYNKQIKTVKDPETEDELVEETTLAESKTKEQSQPLTEARVRETLDETNLPEFAKNSLTATPHATVEQLREAIIVTIEEVKKLSGSGEVFGQSQTEPVTETTTPEALEEMKAARFERIKQEVGLQ